jgi:hypothetical protein
MTTSRRKHSNKKVSRKKHRKDMKDKKDSFSRKRHRRHRRKNIDLVSSWQKHYTYETDITSSETNNNNNKIDRNNEVQAVHGLRDFLQGKKT